MFSKEDAQKEAGNRAFNGLPQLAKLIRGVLEKTISKVGERDAAVRDIATIVSNCMLLYADGCESDIYPLGVLVTDLCSLALLETKENSEKLTKKRVAYKTTCFELAINVLNKLCERQMLCDNNQFLRFVFDVLQEPMLKFQPWMEDDVSSVLAKFVAFSTTLITHAHLKKLWSVVWYRLPLVALYGGTSCANYMRISVALLKHFCYMSAICGDSIYEFVSDLLEKFSTIVRSKNVRTWDGTMDYAVEMLTVLINAWGIECRDELLGHSIRFASTLVDRLDFSVAVANDSEKLFVFFERLFDMAVPDCKPSSLVPTEAYSLAQSCCEVLRKAMLSTSLSHIDFELKREYATLLSRLLVVADSTPSSDIDVNLTMYTQRSKREKKTEFLHIVTEWNVSEEINCKDRPRFVASCLTIGLEVVSRWGHRIEPDRLASMAVKIWAGREHIQLDSQGAQYSCLLHALLQSGALNSLCLKNKVIEDMWNFAMTAVQAPNAFDSASAVLISLCKRYHAVIGSDDEVVDAVSDVLARSTAARGDAVYDLVSILLAEFEFDEMMCFAGAMDKRRGIKEWKFRSQMGEWLICGLQAKHNIGELLFQLCSLHPTPVKRPPTIKSKCAIEHDLDLFGLSEPRCHSEDKVHSVPLVIIDELVEYVGHFIHDFWSTAEISDELRVSLWCSYLAFLSRLGAEHRREVTDTLDLMNGWMCRFVAYAKPEVLLLVQPADVSTDLIPPRLYHLLATRVGECPSIAALLVMQKKQIEISAAEIREVMRGIGIRLQAADSSELRCEAGSILERFTREVDTVPDLLLLFSECGHIIDAATREVLADRITKIIDQDVAEGEYDVHEAAVYRRLLNTCILKSSKAGEATVVDLDAVDAACIVRYLDSLHPSLLDWKFVSRLLRNVQTNVILILKIARVILCDPVRIRLRSQLLQVIANEEKLLQAAQELLPGFAEILDCHYNSLVLSRSTGIRFPYISVSCPLRNDNLVRNCCTGNIDAVRIDSFPAVLFLDIALSDSYEKFVVHVFWRRLEDSTIAVLSSLWMAATIGYFNMGYLLLLDSILAIARSPLRKLVSEKLRRVFYLALISSLSKILHTIPKDRPDLTKLVFDRITASGCLTCAELVLLKNINCESLTTEDENKSEIIFSEAEEFIHTGKVKEVLTLHCTLFWKCLRRLLEETSMLMRVMSSSTKNEFVSRLLFAWDVLPHLRGHIAPVLSLFGDDLSLLCYHKFDSECATQFIEDFCALLLCDTSTTSFASVESCFRILTCEVCRDQFNSRPRLRAHPREQRDGVAEWSSSLYSDLVAAISPHDASVAVIFTIAECASFVPKLCQILAPYLPTMDSSSGESVTRILLAYASNVAHSGQAGVGASSQWRMARCLAECVDGVGLHRLSRLDVGHQMCLDGMLDLIKCCLIANLPEYAFAVANVLHDILTSRDGVRSMAAFDGASATNRRLVEVLRDVYMALGSTAALRTLPTGSQDHDSVRLLFSKVRHDWLDVISNGAASAQDLIDAYWFCGLDYTGPNRQMRYGLALRRAYKWTEVSYPKRFATHEERLFSTLCVCGRSTRFLGSFLDYIEEIECEAAAKSELPCLLAMSRFRDLEVLRLSTNGVTRKELETMPIARHALLAVLIVRSEAGCLTLRSTDSRHLVITSLLTKLCGLKAFAPCLSILEKCTGSLSSVEKCRVLISKCDISTAEHMLRALLESSTSAEPELAVELRCLLAELLADHKNELSEAISSLRQGLGNMENSAVGCEVRIRFFTLLHRLGARQLVGMEEHMESRAFRMREDAIREWTRQQTVTGASQGPRSHVARRIDCELRCEKAAVASVRQNLVASAIDTVVAGLDALKLLSQPYLKQPCQPLERQEAIQRLIFPLIDVIFRFDGDKDVVNAFRGYIASGMVPAVWVNIVGHLMSHCFTRSILAPVIRTMIVKLIIAYPYHVLHTVLMYKFSENHLHVVNTLLEEAERRVSEKTARTRLHDIIENMTLAHVAYIQFVAAKISDARFFKKRQLSGNKVQYEMTDKLSLVSSSDVLRHVPLPIIEQKVGTPGDYSGQGLVMWDAVERVCTQADGLSAPKVLMTKGSDGRLYKTIWKNEDVRQDCLVEQLFSVVNGILNGGESSAFLRTYKVVPLDSKCGIIEFCQGTVSLKELLCGSDLVSGLHAEEEPADRKALEVRSMLKDVAKTQVNQASSLFREACALFKPVFRYFFYKRHNTVRSWTAMIENYRRSLAQWSIVTYVVGLGDRHLSNVLFETETCKLVHIDLGMILEYSKRTLPIPERVPFRLTRDLLDPLLIEGVGGRLAQEAVLAMRLLRENRHVILGLASVLLRETISSFEEVESQVGERPSYVSETAIARLRDKLNGTDDTFGVQDVELQVRRLFAEATNIDNLSRMFVGWMAFV